MMVEALHFLYSFIHIIEYFGPAERIIDFYSDPNLQTENIRLAIKTEQNEVLLS